VAALGDAMRPCIAAAVGEVQVGRAHASAYQCKTFTDQMVCTEQCLHGWRDASAHPNEDLFMAAAPERYRNDFSFTYESL